MSLQFRRCFAVASRKRGNHSSGADTCRPSASVTTKASAVNDTSTASAIGLCVKVLIPRNYKLLAMLFNHFTQLSQLMIAKCPGLCQGDWFQPEFGVFLRALDMDM